MSRIVLIEDDLLLAENTSLILSLNGYECFVANLYSSIDDLSDNALRNSILFIEAVHHLRSTVDIVGKNREELEFKFKQLVYSHDYLYSDFTNKIADHRTPETVAYAMSIRYG